MKSEPASSSKKGTGRANRRSVDPELCDLRSGEARGKRSLERGAQPPLPVELPVRAEAPGSPAFEEAWRNLFAGRTPREVLARIVRGEALGLRSRVSRRLVERALLLDGERCHLRALAHVARASSSYRGQPDFGTWLDGCVDRAIDDLLRGGPSLEEGDPRGEGRGGPEGKDAWSALAQPLKLDPARARNACLGFDNRPFEERSAFFELVLLHRSLDEVAESEGCTPTEIAKRARRAMLALLQPWNSVSAPSSEEEDPS